MYVNISIAPTHTSTHNTQNHTLDPPIHTHTHTHIYIYIYIHTHTRTHAHTHTHTHTKYMSLKILRASGQAMAKQMWEPKECRCIEH